MDMQILATIATMAPTLIEELKKITDESARAEIGAQLQSYLRQMDGIIEDMKKGDMGLNKTDTLIDSFVNSLVDGTHVIKEVEDKIADGLSEVVSVLEGKEKEDKELNS